MCGGLCRRREGGFICCHNTLFLKNKTPWTWSKYSQMLTFVNQDNLIYYFLAMCFPALLNLFGSFNYFENKMDVNKSKNDAQVIPPCY